MVGDAEAGRAASPRPNAGLCSLPPPHVSDGQPGRRPHCDLQQAGKLAAQEVPAALRRGRGEGRAAITSSFSGMKAPAQQKQRVCHSQRSSTGVHPSSQPPSPPTLYLLSSLVHKRNLGAAHGNHAQPPASSSSPLLFALWLELIVGLQAWVRCVGGSSTTRWPSSARLAREGEEWSLALQLSTWRLVIIQPPARKHCTPGRHPLQRRSPPAQGPASSQTLLQGHPQHPPEPLPLVATAWRQEATRRAVGGGAGRGCERTGHQRVNVRGCGAHSHGQQV